MTGSEPEAKIRPVRDDDSAGLIELIRACWAEYPGCVLDVDGEEPWLRAPAAVYAASRGTCWVVEDRGEIVACVGVKPRPDGDAELKSLYVAVRARRRGVGERLTRLVEAEAARLGARRVVLWSDTRFAAAHRLYERLGYVRTGRTRELHDLSQSVEYEFVKRLPMAGDRGGRLGDDPDDPPLGEWVHDGSGGT
jgi:RimJ/RimL family protein N-acetyltransferase